MLTCRGSGPHRGMGPTGVSSKRDWPKGDWPKWVGRKGTWPKGDGPKGTLAERGLAQGATTKISKCTSPRIELRIIFYSLRERLLYSIGLFGCPRCPGSFGRLFHIRLANSHSQRSLHMPRLISLASSHFQRSLPRMHTPRTLISTSC